MITDNLKKDDILSETSYFKVVNTTPHNVEMIDDNGTSITIGNQYVNDILISADQFTDTVKMTKTELAELFIASPRIAMTVCFRKQDKEKGKRIFAQEKKDKIIEIQNARVSEVENLLSELLDNPISNIIPGEIRVMKGRHYGNPNELGRVQFVDMEQVKDDSKDYETRSRQVDPRTINYLIINKIKYVLK